MKSLLFIAMLLGLWLSRSALAELSLNGETFSLSGFGTLGGPYNLDGQAGFIRDKTQPEGARGDGIDWAIDSRLGLQATWRPRDDFEGTLQLVSKYHDDGSYRPQATWAFLKYAFAPDSQVRVGRLGYDIYLFAESRDVGYSYLWVRPPVDCFGQIYNSYFDGLDLTLADGWGEGVLRGKLFLGQLTGTIPTSFRDSEYDLSGSILWGGYIDYQTPHWLFRAGLGKSRLENELPPYAMLQDALRSTQVPQAVALAQDLGFAGKQLKFLAAGIAYDNGPLQSQLALSHAVSDTLSYPGNTAGYWSIGYRTGQWTPYFVYSRIKSTRDDQRETGLPDTPPFEVINTGVAQALSANQANQYTLSLGIRYDFARNVDFKLQVDWIRSRGNPTLLWTDPDPDWDGRATIVSATLDFVF